MNYWRGRMDWPIDERWVCETCNEYHGLTWGMVHAECRCNQCHTQYMMRDSDQARTVLTTPKCLLLPEYKNAARMGWQRYRTPMTEWTDAMWDQAFKDGD